MAQIKEKVNYTINKNEQYNSIEIAFDGIPSKETRDALKALKFRWHGVKKIWYGYAEEKAVVDLLGGTLSEVKNAAAGAVDGVSIPKYEEINPNTLYAGWRGGKNRTWKSTEELKQLLKEDFKKAGVKVTIRQGRGGYLTSLYFTIQLFPEDIRSFEEYKAELENACDFWRRVSAFGWVGYHTDNHEYKQIHIDEAANRINNGEEELIEKIVSAKYSHEKASLTNGEARDDILTESGKYKLATVKQIVSTYNKDCSNGMIDYFDRDIYDWYRFKIA